MKKNGENEIKIKDTSKLLDTIKQNLKKKFADDSKSRTIHWHALNHRPVAEYFVHRPSEQHTVVAHIDYEKLNNWHTNLVWMTTAENYNIKKNESVCNIKTNYHGQVTLEIPQKQQN